jgi:hypothetical protein
VTPTDFPPGLVVRALERLDGTFPGVAYWQVHFPPAPHMTTCTAYHYHAGPGTRAGRIRIGDLAAPEAVRLTGQLYEEAGWTVQVLAGKCSCGLGFRTPPELTRPEAP